MRADGKWDGCWVAHVSRDRYRIIWEMLDAEDDLEEVADQIVTVAILRIGPKTDGAGHTPFP